MPVQAAGRLLVAPQTVSVVIDDLTLGSSSTTSSVIALVGTSEGGTPREWTYCNSYNQVRDQFRGGNLVELAQRLYSPAAGEPGANRVLVYRVDLGVQASAVIQDAATTDTVIDLVSRDYGAHTNQIQVKIEAGSSAGYKASVKGPDSTLVTSKDNIQRAMLSVQYTGSGTTATISVASTGVTTTIDATPTEYTFATYGTVQAIADALIATGDYAVTVVGSADAAGSTLDFVTDANIKASAQTLTAHNQAVIDWLNTETSLVTATRGAAAHAGKALEDMAAFRYLTGGSSGGAVVTDDYDNALSALQGEHCDIVCTDSADAAVHALISAHCVLMSQTGANRERIGVAAGGSDVADAISRAQAINSERMVLAYPALKDYNGAGELVTLGAAHTAAAIAGLIAGSPISEPITRKSVRCVGPAVKLSPSDIDDLLLGGVLPIEVYRTGGARVAQGILTRSDGANAMQREISSRRAADVTVVSVRDRLDSQLVGVASGPLYAQQAISMTNSVLNQLTNEGILVGDSSQPAYSDVSAEISGELLTVSFRASVVTPGNYVIVRATLGAYSAS